MQTSLCPSPDELKAYVRGKLDSDQSDLLSQHMLHCSVCEQTIVEIESEPDTLVELLKCEVAGTAAASSAPDDQRISGQKPSNAQRSDGLQLPTELGQYELQRRLGTGGMGAVYLARHKSLDKQVAIKLLPALPAQHPGFLARFQREMRAAGKLDHPAIVRTTDAGELQGIHFLVMEAIDGMDLSRIVRVEEKLSIADACEIVRQAAIGLAHAHEKGIVHRDVKPSNLMLDRNGQVRILDFGLAQVGLWDSGSAEITTVGQLMGTLDYMAPEQAERGGAVDYRADLYSLGATLFRLLTGRAPLAAAPNLTPLEKLRLLATHKPPRLRSLRSDVPESLSQIVDAMLSRDPALRPASATHSAELLEPFGVGADLVGLLQRANAKPQIDETSFSINPLLQRDLADHALDRSPVATTNSRRSSSNYGRFGRWFPWIASLGSLATLCAGVLVVLETSKGQLVIDSQVDVQVKIVAVDDAGKRNEVDALKISPGSKSTRLTSGKYEIVFDAASDSFGVTNGAFTIRNGQTVVATITPKTSQSGASQTTNAIPIAQPANVEDPRLNEVVYDGQTLDTWLRRLKFERNEAEIERTLTAIATLANPSLCDVLLEPLVDFYARTSNYPYYHPEADKRDLALSRVSGAELPKTVAIILARTNKEEDRKIILRSITQRMDEECSVGFPEFLTECGKLLASKSTNIQLEVATTLRRLAWDPFPSEVQQRLVQMLVDTPSLTDENFWLAIGMFGHSGGETIHNEIVQRAIHRLSDAATSEKLKCQAKIALGALLESSERIEGRLRISEQSLKKLTSFISEEINSLVAQPTQVDSTVILPPSFRNYVPAKLTFPWKLDLGPTQAQDVVANTYVLSMHLIDTCELRDTLRSELQKLNEAMRQLPIVGMWRHKDSNALYNWQNLTREDGYGSILGGIVYLQSGLLLGISKKVLHARFEEKLHADLAQDLDVQLNQLETHGRISASPDDLAKLPFESSPRAGMVFEKIAASQRVHFFAQQKHIHIRSWMRASGDEFLASFARVLAKSSSFLSSHPIGQYPELRCSDIETMKPLLTWCDDQLQGSDQKSAFEQIQLLRSLANSTAPNFSIACRGFVVEHLASSKRLDEINFWFASPLDRYDSSEMRVAMIKKAIERLTHDADPLDALDCQALIMVGQGTSDDWKLISSELQEKLLDAIHQQLAEAVHSPTNSSKLIQLPNEFRLYTTPAFLTVGPYSRSNENAQTNHVILILNFIAKPTIDLPAQTRERLLPIVGQLHEVIEKLNLTDSVLPSRGNMWKSNLERASSTDALIQHTWFTQSGDLLGKSFTELDNRPAKLADEERDRKNRFVQPGDTLAIYIPSILPQRGDPPVIQAGKGQPVTGFPVPVSKEGTIQLPYIPPLVVKDLELSQVLANIEEYYKTKHKVLEPKQPLGITVQYLLRAGSSLELRNVTGSQSTTIPDK